jgi:hypothetical protein
MSILKENKLWRFAGKIKNSDVIRAIVSVPQGLKFRVAKNDVHFGLDVTGRIGMGAMMTNLVLLLRFVELKSMPADIRFTNPLYGDEEGENWLPKYFVIKGITESFDRPCFNISNSWDFRMIGADTVISLAEAHAIFSRRVAFSELVEQTFEDFLNHANMPEETLGVHFRGTDKASEAAIVSQDDMLIAINKAINDRDVKHIFLATDEPSFQEKMIQTFGTSMITFYEQSGVDLNSGGPIHFSDASGSAKALDALINIRLLARCNYIVRTASYMSGWAKVLNPAQEVIMLNKLSTNSHRFPDTEIAYLMQKSGGNFTV